eukprot:TRINITY_DN4967_c0_g1_i1.p1 TRINITY_DN4967_c0_g1~~TRINITY_DN4967_c0_g1_i1.p1  ORF type:complete len:158 (-),score=22.91 TRINITY_DN4967_c0_g1_i1:246-719(-)
MGGDTIEIRNIASFTNRVALKTAMEVFGSVDACHMGNRDNPDKEPAKVRFKDADAANKAFDTIRAGQVFIDGSQLTAEWWSGRKNNTPTSRGGDGGPRRDLELTSRDLMKERMAQRGRDKRSRSRSRSRRRRRSRTRSRSRSRDRRSRSRSRSRRRR